MPHEESHRMTTVRKVYQKAILVPTNHVEQLWKDYENFENSVSRTLVIGISLCIFIFFSAKKHANKSVTCVGKKMVLICFLAVLLYHFFGHLNLTCLCFIVCTIILKLMIIYAHSRQKVCYLNINQSSTVLKLYIESEKSSLMILIGMCWPLPLQALTR